jgi:hypothetical protein
MRADYKQEAFDHNKSLANNKPSRQANAIKKGDAKIADMASDLQKRLRSCAIEDLPANHRSHLELLFTHNLLVPATYGPGFKGRSKGKVAALKVWHQQAQNINLINFFF